MDPNRRSRVAIWCGVVVGVIGSVLLAPIVMAGWCGDGPTAATTQCGSYQRSLVGLDTNVWIWLGAMAVVCAATALVARGLKNAPERRR